MGFATPNRDAVAALEVDCVRVSQVSKTLLCAPAPAESVAPTPTCVAAVNAPESTCVQVSGVVDTLLRPPTSTNNRRGGAEIVEKIVEKNIEKNWKFHTAADTAAAATRTSLRASATPGRRAVGTGVCAGATTTPSDDWETRQIYKRSVPYPTAILHACGNPENLDGGRSGSGKRTGLYGDFNFTQDEYVRWTPPRTERVELCCCQDESATVSNWLRRLEHLWDICAWNSLGVVFTCASSWGRLTPAGVLRPFGGSCISVGDVAVMDLDFTAAGPDASHPGQGVVGWRQMQGALEALGCECTAEWVAHHYRLVVWKLARLECNWWRSVVLRGDWVGQLRSHPCACAVCGH
uniref:DNA ligase 1 n=1 Tax=Lygus hesperus TaxID=30085 RepID=A0A0A9YKR4_LYGHE